MTAILKAAKGNEAMSDHSFTLALCQIMTREEKQNTMDRAEAMVRAAAENGAGVVALPEMFACPYVRGAFLPFSEPADGESVRRMAYWAREYGVVLVGGGAELRGIADYAKQALSLSARVGRPSGLGGVGDEVAHPAFATAVGLMLSDLTRSERGARSEKSDAGHGKSGNVLHSISNKITGVFGKLRS